MATIASIITAVLTFLGIALKIWFDGKPRRDAHAEADRLERQEKDLVELRERDGKRPRTDSDIERVLLKWAEHKKNGTGGPKP